MKFLSVCSGIEAASVAWHPLGWESVAYSEIEPFPCKVLQHHYPTVPNLGDMTKFKEWPDADVDVFVGGTPCQSFSVAGLRKGLDDPRGNLMLTYLAIAKRYRPNWLVWENVPGVLSSAGGRDFGSLLGGLAVLGYGFAYRVLDAQYFGVAQRRRRVFVVGYLGDWRPAAAVLFERHSLQGHPAPSREKGQRLAASVGAGASVGSLCARTGQSISVQDAAQGHLMPIWPAEVSSTLDTTFGTKMGLENQHVNAGCPMFVPAQPIAVGTDCYNGSITGDVACTMGTPGSSVNASGPTVMQPIPLNSMNCFRSPDADPSMGCGIGEEGEAMFTISKTNSHAVAQPSYGIPGNWIGRKPENGGNATEPMYDIAPCLTSADHHGVAQPIAFSGQMSNPQTDVDMTQTLGAKNPMAVAFSAGNSANARSIGYTEEGTPPLRAGASGTNQVPTMAQGMAVRRLTPVECERLQGFPDRYTDIQPKGKATPDGPRYKALGNSMAVPVMGWIGKRIQEVDAICKTQQNK